jgi:hypothetical protein
MLFLEGFLSLTMPIHPGLGPRALFPDPLLLTSALFASSPAQRFLTNLGGSALLQLPC